MDDLKSLVIQSLEEEGTLSALRAQLRSRVFHAIEAHADEKSKQAAGFQWQNPTAQRIHENEESKLVAQLIKEYLEFYRMDYTLSTYVPEVALQNQEALSRDELVKKTGVQLPKDNNSQSSAPILVQLLRQLKHEQTKPNDVVQAMGQPKKEQIEEKKQPAQQQQQQPSATNKINNKVQNYGGKLTQFDDDIDEVIDADDNNFNKDDFNDGDIATSGSIACIDQSIDTQRLGDYDYMEEIS
ncbi:fgfr1 oncogene partner [Stylonychia lemnae]|uniref:Fgfr1 oncogene partner n=1 Tax=Stylonychia lemnae TaxID=5949 RepID=A0A077ZXK7_STYLE|nr:fgfr1 oncogene partner [Stylonychia lemnae]|eukprot:CDW73281.1 fgfr1 oncogene partner [Stylonychia lemnae]